MKKIAIVTATRAEYGLLMPVILKVSNDKDLDLDLIVTGTHLSQKHGFTVTEIKNDGFEISYEIPILEEDNSPYGVSLTMANAIKGFAKCFMDDRPDMVVILGDRTEMLGVACAALNERIPIAHIHGGEITEGAVDDSIRHSITKMSFLHFTSTESYRKRVIQLGEDPKRVFNVGALGAENILGQTLFSEEEIKAELGIPVSQKYVLVTFHPETLGNETPEHQTEQLCIEMNDRQDLFFVITGANSDAGGDIINSILQEYAACHDNGSFFYNLGVKKYLSAVKYAAFVMGNSSSGIIEAPVLGTPTVNIGERQKGRLLAETVVCCKTDHSSIDDAVCKALMTDHNPTKIYGEGYTSDKIIMIIKQSFQNGIELKKEFYNL